MSSLKGTFQKTTESNALACCPCRHFRDNDPDIFYCELQQPEFPALCEQYQQAEHLAQLRTEWMVPDDL